jgi:hypothetical protein
MFLKRRFDSQLVDFSTLKHKFRQAWYLGRQQPFHFISDTSGSWLEFCWSCTEYIGLSDLIMDFWEIGYHRSASWIILSVNQWYTFGVILWIIIACKLTYPG